MENSKKIALVALVLAIIACVGYYFPVSTGGVQNHTKSEMSFGNVVDTSYFDYFDATTGYKLAGTTFLNATSFSLPSGVSAETINGATITYSRNSAASGLNQGTTTPCAVQSPTTASSTLIRFTIGESVSTTTATTITIATSTTQYATTTRLNSFTVAASGSFLFTHVATTSAGSIMNPGDWVVAGQSGGTGTNSPTGSCLGVFQTQT